MNKIKFNDLDENFKRSYLKGLDISLSLASLELEGLNFDGDVEHFPRFKMNWQDLALEYAKDNIDCKRNSEYFYKFDLLHATEDIGEIISNGSLDGFRKKPIEVIGSNVKRSEPHMIREDVLNAYADYLYRYNELELSRDNIEEDEYNKKFFENEAALHIRLLHIHPFEDFNGRTMRTILTVNLLQNNHAPAIVTEKTKREYCDYIENGDIKGLGKFLRKESLKEYIRMCNLYKEYEDSNVIRTKTLIK